MRAGVIAAGAVLALAVVAWWGLRGQDQGGDVVLVPRAAARAQSTASAGEVAEQVERAAQPWVQSEADKAWCSLDHGAETPEISASEAQSMSPKEYRRALAIASIPARQFQDMEDRVAADWIKRLRARGDERSTAAADLLEDSETAKRHLLDLARNSRDPFVYAWAMSTCSGQLVCELSAQRWSQLDPGNAMPWIWEASRARRSGEPQAQREAIYQIGLATHSASYIRQLRQLLQNLAEASSPGLQMSVENWLSMRAALVNTPSARGTSDYCSKTGAETDIPRRTICLAAGDALWRHGEDSLTASMATTIGMRHAPAGDLLWPARRKALDELQALIGKQFEREMDEATAAKDPCAPVAVMHKQGRQIASLGELGYLRSLRDTSPP